MSLDSPTWAVSLVVEVGEKEDEGNGVQEHGQVEALGKVTRLLEHVHTRVNDHSGKLTLEQIVVVYTSYRCFSLFYFRN